MKACKSCEKNLANRFFSKDKRTKDGLSPECIPCKGLAMPGETFKRCLMCQETKDLSDFHRDTASPDEHRRICKKCGITSARSWNKHNKEQYNKYLREWRATNKANTKATQRKSHLKNTYQLTEEEFWMLYDAQGGACYICERRSTKTLHVDHDRRCCNSNKSCGKCVRGLLCSRCNKNLMPYVDHKRSAVVRALDYEHEYPAQALLEAHRKEIIENDG